MIRLTDMITVGVRNNSAANGVARIASSVQKLIKCAPKNSTVVPSRGQTEV